MALLPGSPPLHRVLSSAGPCFPVAGRLGLSLGLLCGWGLVAGMDMGILSSGHLAGWA